MMAPKTRASNFYIRCPHCESKANVRTSRQETRTLRSLICRCTNVLCNFTFVASFEAIQTIAPSATPHAEVDLPRSIQAIAMLRSGALAAYQKPVKKKAEPKLEGAAAVVKRKPGTNQQQFLPQWHSLIHYTVTPKQEHT